MPKSDIQNSGEIFNLELEFLSAFNPKLASDNEFKSLFNTLKTKLANYDLSLSHSPSSGNTFF